jgi:hypothetical protein
VCFASAFRSQQIKGLVILPVLQAVGTDGTGLTQTAKVTFGGVTSTTFTVSSDTQVTATVPTGAITDKIVIKTTGGSVTSSGTFTVTP